MYVQLDLPFFKGILQVDTSSNYLIAKTEITFKNNDICPLKHLFFNTGHG